jgi:LCP family protein required for cell wall assembly
LTLKPAARWRRRGLFGCVTILLVLFACSSATALSYTLFPPESMNILILGLDARPGEGYLARTDSVMLLRVQPDKMQVSLLSIPRDVFIETPGYGERRINTIHLLGEQDPIGTGDGPALVTASLEESFDIDIDHYIRLDFEAFVALIDAVGGIEIDVPEPIIDDEYPTVDGGTMPIRFEPGPQHMDGSEALQYARTRHQDDDFHRAGRQQQVFDALIKKLSDPRQVVNWPRTWQVLRSHTDTDLSAWDVTRIGPALLWGWPDRNHRVLQGDDLIEIRAGYWIPDYDRIMPWIEDHFR